ncbi:MAG: T9SS type A sorting domain-containing protein [Bacteroidales bacterium]|nr:T9SS type A sorting domain-containing protein [Bacteroidales bacterium]
MMKKLTIIALAVLISFSGYSHTWNSIGPDSINASRICFGVGLPYWVICADNGMYLYNYSTYDCEFFSCGMLPVTGAAYMNPDEMLVVMGNGSLSDGIYTFNWQTHLFEVVEWIANPNFIELHEPSGTYWVGTQFGGMFKSSDGLNWSEVSFFEGKSCSCFDYYGEHLVVSEVSNIYNIYWSDDSGFSWYTGTATPLLTDMKFNSFGMLCGIFPDYSNSSGLWRSFDFGEPWEIAFYADNMSAVGFDAFGHIFVGWAENEGIALFDPESTPPGLTFLNSGLPNININKIQLNPSMSAPAIFTCTEGGVYYSYDYLVGIDVQDENLNSVFIYPIPANNELYVQSEILVSRITMMTLSGEAVLEEMIFEKDFRINISGFTPGVYIMQAEVNGRTVNRKLIVE